MEDANRNRNRGQSQDDWGEYTLNAVALEFVHQRLRAHYTLAKLLDKRTNGTVTTLAPRGLKVEDLSRPDQYCPSIDVGRAMMWRDPSGVIVEALDLRFRDEWARALVKGVQHSNAGIVVPSETAEPGDPWLSKVNQKAPEVVMMPFENELHFVLPHDRVLAPIVVALLTLASSDNMIVVVSDELPSSAKQSLTIHDLRRIASGTQEVLVGAYDGEGFVCWKPGQRIDHPL